MKTLLATEGTEDTEITICARPPLIYPLSPRGESVARGAKPLGRGGYAFDEGARLKRSLTLSPTLPRQGGGGKTQKVTPCKTYPFS